MKNLQKLVKSITIEIDRISFSSPTILLDRLLQCIAEKGTFLSEYQRKKYWHKEYQIFGCLVIITGKKFDPSKSSIHDRIYLSVSDPSKELQELLKFDLDIIAKGKDKGRDGVLIQQLEVSYDFHADSLTDVQAIKQYIDKHFVLPFTRASSYNTVKTTNYIGRNGNIRKGSKGTRCYIKTENGRTFCRFEMQFNRSYLKSNGITYNSMPFNPLHFQVFDQVNILGDFSDTGVRNLSRSILRKQGVVASDPDFSSLRGVVADYIREKVMGGSRGARKKVSTQLAELQELKKEAELSVNLKQYFPEFYHVNQLVCCLADTSYEEDGCSKRLILCQGNDSDH